MKFYNREQELQLLEETRIRSVQSSKMTVIVGRRRIGKTSLAMKACTSQRFLYFFVARKDEGLLCYEFIEEVQAGLGQLVLGEYRSFSRLFEYLLLQSQKEPFTLIIDEFQEFMQINASVYSEMQKLWDRYKDSSHIHLILSGSVYSLMKKIFENAKEPLFGRADERIHLKPFNIDVLRQVMLDGHPEYLNRDLLAFYTLTGGVAKYVELFADKNRFTLRQMLNEIFRENSLLLDEGRNLLVEEFGKEYATYFSILSLIASSKTSRTEIESILQKNIGGYLDRLENDYQVIRSVRPVLAKPGGRIQKYFIDDNLLAFWFRFIYKYRSAIEIGNYGYVRGIVDRDFETVSGIYLEKYFREKLALTFKFSEIGRYWERQNDNEVDIVALNHAEKKALIAEVKLNADRISIPRLKAASERLTAVLRGYDIEYRGFSIADM